MQPTLATTNTYDIGFTTVKFVAAYFSLWVVVVVVVEVVEVVVVVVVGCGGDGGGGTGNELRVSEPHPQFWWSSLYLAL